jgi:predicted TIM-barrel fold metal-dependent hydrolase
VNVQQQTEFPQWVRETRAPKPLPPPKSCDCQFHIYGDPAKYPPKKNAYYQPPDATFEHMQGVLKILGIERGVIVHPMPYDTDHTLLIDTLEGMGPQGRKNFRATGIIKDNVTDATLQQLDRLGVCGARFNIGKRYEETTPRDTIMRSMDRAREIGWHARLHVAADDIEADSSFLETFKGWWMMLSNGNRDSKMDSGWDDAVPFGRMFIEAAPDRVVWGTDWPHVQWRKKRMMNDGETVELLYRYVDNDQQLLKKILVDNPARLHGFD